MLEKLDENLGQPQKAEVISTIVTTNKYIMPILIINILIMISRIKVGFLNQWKVIIY